MSHDYPEAFGREHYELPYLEREDGLLAKIKALKAILRRVEWAGMDGACPVCGAYNDGVHVTYCDLAKAIR